MFRNVWIASAVWVVTLAILLVQSEQKPLDYILGSLLALVLLLVLNRYGLLACVVSFFCYLFLTSVPLTVDVNRWYIGTSIAVVAIFAAFILWSLRSTLARSDL